MTRFGEAPILPLFLHEVEAEQGAYNVFEVFPRYFGLNRDKDPLADRNYTLICFKNTVWRCPGRLIYTVKQAHYFLIRRDIGFFFKVKST